MITLQNIEGALKKGLILNAYLAAWFLAIEFLNNAILQQHGVAYLGYGFAILKASASAKFMLVGQKLLPLEFKKGSSVLWLTFRRSLIDTGFVLALSYVFAGLEGFFHHKGFIESMQNFCSGNLDHVAALIVCYWLIILPYLAYCGLKRAMGAELLEAYLLGTKD